MFVCARTRTVACFFSLPTPNQFRFCFELPELLCINMRKKNVCVCVHGVESSALCECVHVSVEACNDKVYFHVPDNVQVEGNHTLEVQNQLPNGITFARTVFRCTKSRK